VLALGETGLGRRQHIALARNPHEAPARMRILVETSPGAIVTIDERGFSELANRAALELTAPKGGALIQQPIAALLPELHHALRGEEGPQFRPSMQCRGHRGNGESFPAEVWFSTYKEGPTPKPAAIIADVTEEQTVPAGSGSAMAAQRERPAVPGRVGQLRSVTTTTFATPGNTLACLRISTSQEDRLMRSLTGASPEVRVAYGFPLADTLRRSSAFAAAPRSKPCRHGTWPDDASRAALR